MNTVKKVAMLLLIAAVVSLGLTGCNEKESEHPVGEHPASEQPSEHPTEHPK